MCNTVLLWKAQSHVTMACMKHLMDCLWYLFNIPVVWNIFNQLNYKCWCTYTLTQLTRNDVLVSVLGEVAGKLSRSAWLRLPHILERLSQERRMRVMRWGCKPSSLRLLCDNICAPLSERADVDKNTTLFNSVTTFDKMRTKPPRIAQQNQDHRWHSAAGDSPQILSRGSSWK